MPRWLSSAPQTSATSAANGSPMTVPSGPIAARYRISGYPTVFLIDRQGKIRYAGSASNAEFYDVTIKNMLAETDKDAKGETHAASR